jgi:ABC-type uncharacterized transport system involved in gliding motility auxiliary subunit
MSDELKPEPSATPETTPPAAAPPPAPEAAEEGWTMGKRVGAWINTIVMTLLVVGILVGLNYLGSRNFVRYDMTANQEYRISERTRTILGGMKSDVEIFTVFLTPSYQMSYEEWNARERLESVLAEFRNCSPRVRIEALSFGMEQAVLKAKVKEMNLQSGLTDRSVIVRAGGRSKSIALTAMYEMNYAQRFGRISSFNAEGQLVAAIQELTEEKPPVVTFTKGHGTSEGKVEKAGQRDDGGGLGWIVNRLKERENIEQKTLNLVQAKEIPSDVKVLVIHRPATKYGEHEVNLLRDYLKRGGRLCVMVDPVDEKGFLETGLEGLLAEWGVKLGRNIVFMSLGPFLTERPIVQLENFGTHPIVDKFRQEEIGCKLGLSRSVEKVEGGETRLEVTPLITLTEGAWGETSLTQIGQQRLRVDPEDLQGTVPLAQAVKATVGADVASKISPESRIVVFGNTEFVTDRGVREGGNEDLFVNALLWLIDREKGIGIGAKSIADRRVTLTDPQQANFFWAGVVGLPALSVLLGFALWFVRRK